MKKTCLVLILTSFVILFSIPINDVSSQTQTCPPNPIVQEILNQITQDGVIQWIRDFSGEDLVSISGSPTRILTRHSVQLLNSNSNALAYPYLT